MFSSRIFLLAVLIGWSLPSARAAEGEWAEGYELAAHSKSPNGRYGVLLPSRLAADAIDDEKIRNYLVDLKTHRRLGVIRGVRYFPGQNHFGIQVAWAADSSWAAVSYEARYGFGIITLVEIHGKNLAQTDLGKHIQKTLNEEIARQPGGSDGCYGSAYFRAAPGRKVLVRATGLTNPKGLDQPTCYALFQGTYDLATGKWTRSESRKIDNYEPFEAAYTDTLEEGTTFSSDEDRRQSLDEKLNEVYGAVRVVLPAERFAEVKKAQIAWLKQLEASSNGAAKCKSIATRIKQLRQLMW